MGLHHTKKLLHGEETTNKTKRQPTEWEKVFVNNIANKWLIPKYTKNSYNSTAKTKTKHQKPNNMIKK